MNYSVLVSQVQPLLVISALHENKLRYQMQTNGWNQWSINHLPLKYSVCYKWKLLNHKKSTKIISKPFSVSSCHFHSFLFTLFIPKCLFQFKCLAHIPLLCLSLNIIPRQVQLLSHNRVCLLVLVSGQPFSSLHHFLSFVNLFPLAYTVRFQCSLPLIEFPL